MRIAILILAFKNPHQLRQLVDVLKKDHAVYIHFDKRSSLETLFPEEENVHIIQKRYALYWGSLNAQLATLELLEQAYKDDNDYFILISGQDLPVMNSRELTAYLEVNYKDHLYNFKLPGTWGGNGGLDRLTLFWDTKYRADTLLRRMVLFPYRVLFSLVRVVQKALRLERKIPFEAYGGSFCLNLTRNAVAYILSFVKENPWYTRRFKYTRCTDEIFFQTILLGYDYPLKHAIVNDDKRYQNWVKGPTYPRVLTVEDLADILNSGAFFARKFDDVVDSKIITELLNRAR